jgi:hypothetical protein
MTDAEIQAEWADLVDDVENGLIQKPEQQFQTTTTESDECERLP